MPYQVTDKNILPNGLLIALCDNLRAGIAIVEGQAGIMIFSNDALLRLFEAQSINEIYKGKLNRFREIKLTDEEIEKRYQVAEEEGNFTEEVEYLTAKGNRFWGELSIKSLPTAPGYYLVEVIPIDRIKEKEKKLLQNLQRFDALFEHASMGIIELNQSGEIVNVNPFTLNLFGYDKEEVINKQIELLIPERFYFNHLKYKEDFFKNPHSRPMGVGMDLYAARKDGTEFPVEISLTSYTRNEENYIIAFISDISLRKETELKIKKLNESLEEKVEQRTRELKKAVAELEESKEKLSKSLEKEKELGELKSRFVSMASHEFRTPLSTVLSSSYLLEKYATTEEQPKREKHLQRIVSSVNMLTDILNDFLNVGKIEEGKIHVRLATFNIRELISSTIDEIKISLKKRQNIHFSHEGEATATSDTSLLKHILMNLVSNASKFSPEASDIEIKSINKKEYLQLSVKDHGIGISKQDQEHLMERFFRAANVANIQGTGLGLHIVSKYAELMNGVVECESELEKGTEFKITFNKIKADEKDTADRRQ